jgi:hypothetical protein
VQKFALIALFAKASEPMFADNAAVTPDMSEWASRSSGAASFGVEFTNCTRGFYQNTKLVLAKKAMIF